ncbi:MAG: hypothetical protein J6V06_05390, partial [Clostridia bacterium]|nr:hypothetical protein [Clostridia bacterium]
VSILLEGVLKNINAYFKNKDNSYKELIEKVSHIYNNMCEYANELEERYHIKFNISNYILEFFNTLK